MAKKSKKHLSQHNSLGHKQTKVKLPKSNLTLEEWAEKYNAQAPAHIFYKVEE